MRATLVVTAPGVTAIGEMSRLLAGFEVTVVTTFLRSVSPEGLEEAWEHLDYTVDQVATTAPDVVVQNTVAFCLNGDPDAPDEVRRRMTSATGAPTAVGLSSTVAALREVEVRRPLVVAPYPEALEERFRDVLHRHGITVSGWAGPLITDPATIHRATADADTYVARGLAEAPAADGVLICGGGWSSLDVAARLEARLDIPVLTSNVAEAWHARRLCGVAGRPPTARHWATFAD